MLEQFKGRLPFWKIRDKAAVATAAAAHERKAARGLGARRWPERFETAGDQPQTAKTDLISFDTILTVLELLMRLAPARDRQTR